VVVLVPFKRIVAFVVLAAVLIYNLYVVFGVPAILRVLYVVLLVKVILSPYISVKSSLLLWFPVKSLNIVVVSPIFDLILKALSYTVVDDIVTIPFLAFTVVPPEPLIYIYPD
jgi:hypothetical protein